MLVFLGLQETTTSLPTCPCFLVFFPHLQKTMISQEARCRLLVFSSSAEDDNEPGSRLVIVFGCFASIAKDDNEPPNSLSFFAFFLHVQMTTMSQEACRHLLIFFLRCRKRRRGAKIPTHCCLWLFYFSSVKVKSTTRKLMHILIMCTQSEQLKNVGREEVSWFFPQVWKMTRSLLAHCHLFFFLGVKDDDEPRGSSSSFFSSQVQKMTMSQEAHPHLLFFHVQQMAASLLGSLSSFCFFFLKCKR